MRIEFNRTGAERKALVQAMGEILEAAPKYLGMPTMAYEVGGYIIDKDSGVEFDSDVDSNKIETLLEQLAKRGFTAAAQETADAAPGKKPANDTDEADTAPQGEGVGLTVAVPLASVAVGNLTKLLDAKGSLIIAIRKNINSSHHYKTSRYNRTLLFEKTLWILQLEEHQ